MGQMKAAMRGCAGAVALLAAITVHSHHANALSFGFTSGGDTTTLHGFDLSGTTGLHNGSQIITFGSSGGQNSSASKGLIVIGATANTVVDFEYLGFEAGNSNHAYYKGGVPQDFFFNKGSHPAHVGDKLLSQTLSLTSKALLKFGFKTLGEYTGGAGKAINGLTKTLNIAIGFYIDPLHTDTVIALFNDNKNPNGDDKDYDDLAVRITLRNLVTTPLPGALPLFAGGLALMGWFGRRKARLAGQQHRSGDVPV